MPDNIAYQASRGNWIIHEDGSTGAGFNNNNSSGYGTILDITGWR
jgi:hypothetical protein